MKNGIYCDNIIYIGVVHIGFGSVCLTSAYLTKADLREGCFILKRFAAVVMVFVMLVSASVTAFADSVMSETEVKTDTSSGSGGSGGSFGGSGGIGGGVGGIGGGGSQTAHTGLPNVNFAVTYQKNSSCFKVEAEVNSEDCGQDAEVMSAVYKNGVFQKLLFSIKLDSDSVYDKKITRYSIVSESDNPEDFCFKCFTLGEDIRPLLPAYTVTGKEAMGGSEKQTVTLRGVVTANSATDIYSAETAIGTADSPFIRVALTENRTEGNADFEIPSVQTFAAGDTDAEDYLGMAVIMDVEKAEDASYRVVSIGEDTEINNTVTFPLNCFDLVDESGYVNYYANDTDANTTKAMLSNSLSVVYNNVGGQTLTDILSDEGESGYVEPFGRCTYSGDVTLIDNDDCGGYDVVLVNIAAPVVVDSVSDGIIIFKDSAWFPNINSLDQIDTEYKLQRVDIIKDGKKTDCTGLSEWDVLSVYAAADNAAYICAEVITNKISGKVSSNYSSDSSYIGKGYEIGGTRYDAAAGAFDCIDLRVEDEGVFYIDKYGRIAAYRRELPGSYAYVYKSNAGEQNFETYVKLQLITENGVAAVEFAPNVVIYAADGTRTVLKLSKLVGPEYNLREFLGTDINGQVIRYTTNSEGKIESIRFADYNGYFEKVYYTAGAEMYNAANNKLGKYIDADSIIFFINPENAQRCSVCSTSDLSDGATYKVLKMYRDYRARNNNIIVIEGNNSATSKSANLAVVTEASTNYDEEGNSIYCISYITNGCFVYNVDTVDIDCLDGVYAGELPDAGDIVKIKTNREGKISGITPLWNMREDVRNDTIADTDYVERKAEGDPAGTAYGEVLYGGAVTVARDSDRLYFGDVDWNSETGLMDQVNDWVNISTAKNIYTIQTIRDGNVSVKKNGSFNYVSKMFDNSGNYSFVYDGRITSDVVTKENLPKYVDHVYVREYNGIIEDVVIVKAPKKVSVR